MYYGIRNRVRNGDLQHMGRPGGHAGRSVWIWPIWGVKRAATIYFGKRPDELSPLEGAFIMANKPDPPYGYYMYRRGKVNDRWKKKLGRVMDRLHHQMGVINAAQYKAESHFEPRFRRPGGDEPPAAPPPAVDGEEEPEEPLPAAPEEP